MGNLKNLLGAAEKRKEREGKEKKNQREKRGGRGRESFGSPNSIGGKAITTVPP